MQLRSSCKPIDIAHNEFAFASHSHAGRESDVQTSTLASQPSSQR